MEAHVLEPVCAYRPLSCVWELTRACDMACRHCGSSAGSARDDELGTDRCLGVVHELAALGNKLLSLSGGEPTLRKDWPVIAREAVGCGIWVNMITNGQSEPERLARLARDAKLANLGVSVDGLEATHDSIRRPGAFSRATRTIRVLAEAGLWVDVMHTVTRASLPELEPLCDLAQQLGARAFRVQLAKPMGNLLPGSDLLLRPADLLTLLPALGRLATTSGIEVRVGDSVGYYSPQEKWLRKRSSPDGLWTGCKAGTHAVGIQSDGGVKGCLSLQPRHGEPDSFVEGNLKNESLQLIWTRDGAFSYNRAFELSNLRGACARCAHARMCRGGARCVAHAVHGDVSCDPMCYAAEASRSFGAAAMLRPMVPVAATLLFATSACGSSDYGVEAPPMAGAGGDASIEANAGGSPGLGGSGGWSADATPDVDPDASPDAPPDADPDVSPDAPPDVASDGTPDATIDGVDCSNVCCECDYGDIPPPECCP
jgi:radical SAM protein with 4Fe4S-binding SPASM domain